MGYGITVYTFDMLGTFVHGIKILNNQNFLRIKNPEIRVPTRQTEYSILLTWERKLHNFIYITINYEHTYRSACEHPNDCNDGLVCCSRAGSRRPPTCSGE